MRKQEIDFPENMTEEEKEELKRMFRNNQAINKDKPLSNITHVDA